MCHLLFCCVNFLCVAQSIKISLDCLLFIVRGRHYFPECFIISLIPFLLLLLILKIRQPRKKRTTTYITSLMWQIIINGGISRVQIAKQIFRSLNRRRTLQTSLQLNHRVTKGEFNCANSCTILDLDKATKDSSLNVLEWYRWIRNLVTLITRHGIEAGFIYHYEYFYQMTPLNELFYVIIYFPHFTIERQQRLSLLKNQKQVDTSGPKLSVTRTFSLLRCPK
jgi:hypothetical protein